MESIARAGVKDDFVLARLYVAEHTKEGSINEGQEEVPFKCEISAGKYDAEAQLIDRNSKIHSAYYVYIEWVSN